ncbi:GET complex subunit get1 [Coniosporium apollinis]|uniref:GET complex subunit get1 n=2 Tax=Coniosporium TaxID=2810619 RepID=A0ABQ9NLK8_9PEZI|nr:GET complex subunit get1 [Cladosporium sp. JES 115]KAJ9656942.1 GET complex subunit get1 [Coniosporium apollinis]
MVSPLLVVFVLQVVIHLINTIGATAINELLWILYNKFPTPTAKAAHDQMRLKREVVRLKREMNTVSAQDDFARWAKLRRQHDKAVAEFNKSDSAIQASRTTFNTTITSIRWLSTNGLRLFLQFWYARQALFWIPKGWLPGYMEWILAFPRAPRGSVSIQIWAIACASVVGMISEAVVAAYALGTQKTQAGAKRKPMAFTAAEKGGAQKEL